MFQLKEAIFVPSFPLFVTILSPLICTNVVNFAWSRMGNAHSLAAGRAITSWWMVKKLLEVVTFPTTVIQKRKSAHEVNLTYLLLLYFACFLPFVSYSHLFLYSYTLICFTSSGVQRPGKEISMSFSQTFNLFFGLSLYWTLCPRIQKQFASGI